MRPLQILLPILMFSVLSTDTRAAVSSPALINADMPLKEFIKQNRRAYSKARGQHLSLKQFLGFQLMKKSMKKAVRKNQDVTVREYLLSNQKSGQKRNILIILLLLVLFGFLVFVITFQDKI